MWLIRRSRSIPEVGSNLLVGGASFYQKKVILARWLATNPRVLIMDEPTRWIDMGAKEEIQKLVMELAEEGKSCVYISSELEEVQRVSDRVAVMRDQKKVAEFAGDVDDKTHIQTMAGES